MTSNRLFVRRGCIATRADLEVELSDFAAPPALVWIEPKPELKRGGDPSALRDFPGVWQGLPRSLPAVNEMRLSWPNSTRHYVVSGSSFLWVAFSIDPFAADLDFEILEDVREETRSIVWRRDLDRFFGPNTREIAIDARVRAFWKGGRLITWWLVKDGRAA